MRAESLKSRAFTWILARNRKCILNDSSDLKDITCILSMIISRKIVRVILHDSYKMLARII